MIYKGRSAKNRAANRLGRRLENTLLNYGAAASAAGVGILALIQPANAKVIVTPTHKRVLPNQTLKLELDNDGTTEFSLKIFNSHLNNGRVPDRTESKPGPSLGGGGAIRSGGQSDFNLGLRNRSPEQFSARTQ
jgi:hypothetical protein